MALVLVRVDDRLVHGQVAVGWSRAVGADWLVVANDAAARDDLQKSLMQMGTPPPLQARVYSVEDAAHREVAGEFAGPRVILLFATPKDALRFIEAGGKVPCLNVGGMRHAEGKRAVLDAVSVSDADCDALRAIAGRGVELECRLVPTDRKIPLLPLLASKA